MKLRLQLLAQQTPAVLAAVAIDSASEFLIELDCGIELARQAQPLFDALVTVIPNNPADIDSQLLRKVVNASLAAMEGHTENQQNLTAVLGFLMQVYPLNSAHEVDEYCRIIAELKKESSVTLALWAKIFASLDLTNILEQREHLIKIHRGIVANPAWLREIAALYDFSPYPSINVMAQELQKTSNDLKKFIDGFDADPKGVRAPRYDETGQIIQSKTQIIDAQCDLSAAKQSISEIRHCIKDKSLSAARCFDLAQQITYINALAKDYPLTLGTKSHTNLMSLKRQQLCALFQQLVDQIRARELPGLSSHSKEQPKLKKEKAQLNLLAVLREQYFRSTGIFISAEQLLLLLLTLHQPDSNLLLEVEANDKELITPLLAVMQWVITGGDAIDVCVASRDILARQFNNSQNFFNSLDIPCAQVYADSVNYKEGGINYSTLPDLALCRVQEITDKRDHSPARHLILDNVSHAAFNFNALFELSHAADTGTDLYDWIYPLINEFVGLQEATNIDDNKANVALLKQYLKEHPSPSVNQQLILDDISEQQFIQWYEAGYKVQHLVLGDDFALIADDTKVVPLLHVTDIQRSVSEDFIFAQGMQQLLQARLQQQYPNLRITPELASRTDVASVNQLLDSYRLNGRAIALVEHINTQVTLAEHDNLLTLEHAYRLSPYLIHQDKLDASMNEQILHKINHMLAKAEDGQPIVLLGKDAHHAQWLYQQLMQQIVNDGLPHQLVLINGDESEQVQQQRLKEHAGNPQVITIIPSSVINRFDLVTDHNKGFYIIQPYFDNKSKIKKVLDRALSTRDTGRYAVIYGQDGQCMSHSWSYKLPQEKRHFLKTVGELSHKKNQQEATLRHDINAVAIINATVLDQFQEWQELYALFCSAEEYHNSSRELIKQKEQLVDAMTALWRQLYIDEQNNPEFSNDEDHQQLIATYQNNVELLWLESKQYIQDKIEPKIEAGSVNALRYDYLNRVSFAEQVRLKQIATNKHAALAREEKKKCAYSIDDGFEINGAMLHYSDAKASEFSPGFIREQLQKLRCRLVSDIRHSALSQSTRMMLISKVERAKSLLEFELILKSYGQRLDTIDLLEKYRLQPIVAQLTSIYSRAGLDTSTELEALKKFYYDDSTRDILYSLEQALSWAKPDHRGLGFWLERSAVKTAATEILAALEVVKNARPEQRRQQAIKDLYKLLAYHQAQLDGLWIFSFGHKNTRELINQTLNTLNDLVVLANSEQQLHHEFINECREDAQKELMQAQFWLCVANLEKKKGTALSTNDCWQGIKQELRDIQLTNNTVYSLDEMYCLLSSMMKWDEISTNQLIPHLVQLRGALRNLWSRFSHDHKDLAHSSRYFANQQTEIATQLKDINGGFKSNVVLRNVNKGCSDYLELMIEGEVADIDASFFADFVAYCPQTSQLLEQQKAFQDEYLGQRQRYEVFLQFEQQWLHRLKLNEFNGVDAIKSEDEGAIPASLLPLVNEIQLINKHYLGELPAALDEFEPEAQAQLLDREALRSFKFETLDLVQINALHCEELKANLTNVYNKMNQPAPAKTFLSSWLPNFSLKEGVDDWRHQLVSIISEQEAPLKNLFQKQSETKLEELESMLRLTKARLEQKMQLNQEKQDLIDSKITELSQVKPILLRQFSERGEFYQYLHELKQYQQEAVLRAQDNAILVEDLSADGEQAEDEQLSQGSQP